MLMIKVNLQFMYTSMKKKFIKIRLIFDTLSCSSEVTLIPMYVDGRYAELRYAEIRYADSWNADTIQLEKRPK